MLRAWPVAGTAQTLANRSSALDERGQARRVDHASKSRAELRTALFAATAAFGAYFAMYGFRKPFTAGISTSTSWFGLDGKTVLVGAQVFGYTISKFVGIRVCAEIAPSRRVVTLLLLVGCAWAALWVLPLVPAGLQPWCLFANGLPLGMVFGLVMGFLEGRRMTEAAVAGLCASFIIADGFAKSVGSLLLAAGVPWQWMPAAAGAVFAPLLLGSVMLLRSVPPPDALDVAARTERAPMTRADRQRFLARHGVGLAMLVVAYLGITVMRSVRADFAPELWQQLGHAGQPSVFTTAELLVALLVLLANAASVWVRDNARAFVLSILLASAGLLLALVATGLWSAQQVDGYTFMVLVGLGLYLPYVAMHTTIFERLVAMTRDRGNLGFLMYLADSFGYLGYVAVMFLREGLGAAPQDLLRFFLRVVEVGSSLGLLCFLAALAYFVRRSRKQAVAIAR